MARELVTVTLVLVLIVFLAADNSFGYDVHVDWTDNTGYHQQFDYKEEHVLAAKRAERKKRDDPQWDKTIQGECIERSEGSGDKAGHTEHAVMAALGTEARLPCKLCGTDEKETHRAKTWFKFERQWRPENNSHWWRAVEVLTDLHDNEDKNRIVVTSEHMLVFNKVQAVDRGVYFCQNYDQVVHKNQRLEFQHHATIEGVGAMSIGAYWAEHVAKFNKHRQNINFIIYMDISFVTKTEALRCNQILPGSYPAAPFSALPRSMRDNWEIVTDYSRTEPTKCSVCGEETTGVSLQRGFCVVRKMQPGVTRPAFLQHVLLLYGQVPCHSTIFLHWPQFFSQPDYTCARGCQVSCSEEAKNLFMDRLHVDSSHDMQYVSSTSGKDKKPPGKVFNIIKAEGEAIMLHCPGTLVIDPVKWTINNVTVEAVELAERTSSRVVLDILSHINIYHLQPGVDDGHYTCWLDGTDLATYNIKVKVMKREDVLPYLKLLGLSYFVNFVIFLALLSIRHSQTAVQSKKVVAAKSYDPETSSSSCQSSSEESTDSSSDSDTHCSRTSLRTRYSSTTSVRS